MTEEMKAIISAPEKHIAVIARAGCVDKDTEFFTGKGWKKISEYEEGDMVLQFNKDWTVELVKPKQYIKEPCDMMNGIISKYGVDMVLSDEHRVIYVDNSHGKKWGTQNILETTCSNMVYKQMKNKSGFTGKFITTFKIKDGDYKYFSSDDEIRLYMAVLSDGSIKNKRTNYVVMHLKKQRKKDRLVSILKNLNMKYVEYHRKDGYTDYSFHFDKATKMFDFELLQINEHDRKVLFDEIPYWDGYYEEFKRNGDVIFFTSIKHNADFIQMLGASLNKRGSIDSDDRIGEEQLATNGKVYIRKSRCYRVGFTDRTLISVGFHSNPENRFKNLYSYKTLDGYKYCFTVDSGMLILRRNDKIFVTGNSGKTFTMLEYIKARPNEKILFLVYNKEMQVDFSKRVKEVNIKNATVVTIHSLAYKWFIKKYGKRNFRNISIVDVKKALRLNKVEYKDLSMIKFYYDMFLCSDLDDPFKLQLISDDDDVYLPYVKQLFEYYCEADTIQHNVYLKMFQLSKDKIEGYDTILADEVNDHNHCMLSIIENNLDKKVIMVGDPLQNLNSFNYTLDGLGYMIEKHKFKEYNLTMSFRISEDVASLSSRYLTYMYNENIRFHGNKHTKICKIDLARTTPQNQVHLLCRNRLGGLMEILSVLEVNKNKKIYYVGGLESFGLSDIEKLLQYSGYIYIGGEKFHISTLRRLKQEDIKDPEISKAVSLYDFGKKNEALLPLLRYTETTNKEEADIIVQTAHSSKGLTVKNVYIASDFKPIEELKKEMLLMKESGNEYLYNIAKSEINLIYVALTRATDYLDLNEVLNKKEKQTNRIDIESESDVMLKRR